MDVMLRDKAEELAKEIAVSISTQQELSDVMRLMTKSVIERMLDAEMDVHLDQERGRTVPVATTAAAQTTTVCTSAAEGDADRAGKGSGRNRRNGTSAKTVQGESGRLAITTPRDRNSTFEPLLIPKHERRLAGFDDKVLALYAKGMSTRDIQELVKTLYGVELSATLISSLTDAVDEEVTAWRSRPLEAVWPIVYFDGIVVHVRGANGRVSQHTIYVALGVNLAGKKELLGLWLAESEGAKFWLQVLTDLKNRGLGDIFVACVDGLAGFPEAIRAAYPQTKVQLCVVHLVRSALRYVTDQDSAAVVRDLKKIYEAATLLEAEQALEDFAQAWQASYPTIIKMWRAKWTDIITLFDFPAPIRKAISTTNAIESVNSVIRKFTRNRKIYPNEESALKITFMAIREASKKWTMPIKNWKAALNHFAILYEDRLPTQSETVARIWGFCYPSRA
jgi:transposase-like protein